MIGEKQDNQPKTNSSRWKVGCLWAGGIFLGLGILGTIMGERKPAAPSPAPVASAPPTTKVADGFHCLSKWDGSHRQLVNDLKRGLRDPDSFKHVETRIAPADKQGDHMLFMEYRARNGLGGMMIGKLAARVKDSDCSFTILANTNE